MTKKLLFIICIATLSLNLVACSNNSESSIGKSNNDVNSVESTSIVTTIADEESNMETTVESTTEAITEEEKLTVEDVVNKALENTNNTKTYQMNAEMNMSADINVAADAESGSQSMSVKCLIDSSSNDSGIHIKTNMTTDEGSGPETITEEKYIISSTNLQYTSTDGETWVESEATNDNLVDLNNLFGDTSNFENATMETKDDSYIITVDVTDIDSFSSNLTKDLEGMNFTGSMIIIIDEWFYPTSIELTNVDFDTQSIEEVLSSTAIEESEAAPKKDINLDINVNLNFDIKLNYTAWNAVADSEVLPADDIITNSTSLIEKETVSQEVEVGR